MNNLDVPEAGRIRYVNQNLESLMRAALKRQWSNDSAINTQIKDYNGLEILYVPQKRFKTLIELNSGENNEWGFTTPAGAKDINFILMQPKTIVQASKTARGKFITADENQRVDSNEFQFRVFHDAFVIDRLKDGVYASIGE